MNVSEKQKGYIQDYRITVFDIAYLEDETIEKFRSDFKHVAQFFKCRRLNDKDALKRNKMVTMQVSIFREVFSGIYARKSRGVVIKILSPQVIFMDFDRYL